MIGYVQMLKKMDYIDTDNMKILSFKKAIERLYLHFKNNFLYEIKPLIYRQDLQELYETLSNIYDSITYDIGYLKKVYFEFRFDIQIIINLLDDNSTKIDIFRYIDHLEPYIIAWLDFFEDYGRVCN